MIWVVGNNNLFGFMKVGLVYFVWIFDLGLRGGKAHSFVGFVLLISEGQPTCSLWALRQAKESWPKQIEKRAQWPVKSSSPMTKFHSSPLTFGYFYCGPRHFHSFQLSPWFNCK